MKKELEIVQKCINKNCSKEYPYQSFLFKCPSCGGSLEYEFRGKLTSDFLNRNDLWRYFQLLPLEKYSNIVSDGAGRSDLLKVPELSEYVNGANVYILLDSHKNPTGTFKDREATVIISRCKEQNMNNLVFYSTGNTGRAYTHLASEIGLNSYFFMPEECDYKNTNSFLKGKNNNIILIKGNYQEVSPYASKFAKENGFNMIAPLHDRTESYATVAYEQFEQMPDCQYFVQTIASGMGALGFYKGHLNLVNIGLQERKNIPRAICIQSSETNSIATVYNRGSSIMIKDDLPVHQTKRLFEPTLNSTNPINNYPHMYKFLTENKGVITDVEPEFVQEFQEIINNVLADYGRPIRNDLEKSLLIEFGGVVKLAKQGMFKKGENILMMACGRANETTEERIVPDAVVDPENMDCKELLKALSEN